MVECFDEGEWIKMKIDRLIGILSLLLQKDTVTAPDLAERFEVSRRTISRDIEDLCKAGIPIVTRQGNGGGISIMDNYKISKTLITNAEMLDILAGLRSLDSVNGTSQYKQLMEKLSGGESVRSIEPYYLIFRWSDWYVWGWCEKRQDYRLFKLNRLEQLIVTESAFTRRQAALPDLSNERIFPGEIHVRALFQPECKWRLVEEFGTECYEEQADGKLLFHADYSNEENLISWILSFGDKAELLEPAGIRKIILGIAENTIRNYKKPESNT